MFVTKFVKQLPTRDMTACYCKRVYDNYVLASWCWTKEHQIDGPDMFLFKVTIEYKYVSKPDLYDKASAEHRLNLIRAGLLPVEEMKKELKTNQENL